MAQVRARLERTLVWQGWDRMLEIESASDTGRVGQLIRGDDNALLVDGAEPSLPAPERALRLRDAFTPSEDAFDR